MNSVVTLFLSRRAFMPKKSILMLVGDYVEDYELMVPFQALLMVGHTVHAVCHGNKSGKSVRTAIHDFDHDQTYPQNRVGPHVTQAGGTYVNLAMTEAIADGNLVTAPAWPAHPAWLAKFLTVLGTKIEL